MKKKLLLSSFLLLSIACSKEHAPKLATPAGNTFNSIEPKDAVIYELFVRDFTQEGTINAIIPRLDELKTLGVNVIWLMPIYPIGILKRIGTYGSPYSVKDYYSVNPDLGTKDDLKNLVTEIHKRGMAIILDWVANHTSWDNQWIYDHPDWYTHDANGNIVSPNPSYTDVADLNYDNDSMRSQMTDAMKYWINEYDIDGYRCDAADMVPTDFWMNAVAQLRTIKPLIMLAEGAGTGLYDAGFDLTYAWNYYTSLKNVWSGFSVSTLQSTLNGEHLLFPAGSLRLRFTTNHDETFSDNPPVILFNGINGAKAASVLAIFTGGVPMIYNGQEVGSNQKLSLFEKTPINWTTNAEMATFYSEVFQYYDSTRVMRDGNTSFLSTTNDIAIIMRATTTDTAFVVVNTRNALRSCALPELMQHKNFYDPFLGSVVTVDSLVLNNYEFRILNK